MKLIIGSGAASGTQLSPLYDRTNRATATTMATVLKTPTRTKPKKIKNHQHEDPKWNPSFFLLIISTSSLNNRFQTHRPFLKKKKSNWKLCFWFQFHIIFALLYLMLPHLAHFHSDMNDIVISHCGNWNKHAWKLFPNP